jgi:hypothetical protein
VLLAEGLGRPVISIPLSGRKRDKSFRMERVGGMTLGVRELNEVISVCRGGKCCTWKGWMMLKKVERERRN